MFTRGMKPRQKRAATNVLNRMQANPDWARQVRERAKLTLEEMGRLCGASHSSVSRWERMVTMPDDADEAYGAWVSILDRWAGNEPVRGSRLIDALACSVAGCDWIPEGPEPFSHNSPEARDLARQAVRHQRECVLRHHVTPDDTTALQRWHRVSIVPVSKPQGAPKRYMVRCNDCLRVLDQ